MLRILSKNFSYLLAIVILAQYSCKKVSNISIDNDNVIRTPYSLYVANYAGALFNTNDGEDLQLVFPADGYAPKAIVTSSENLLFVKNNLHLSTNNGKNFAMVYNKVNHQPWQEQIVDVPLQGMMYVSSNEGKGVAYSNNNGISWQVDTMFNPLMPNNYDVTSFAAMNDGSVYGFSNVSMMLIKKIDAGDRWNPVVVEGLYPADDGQYFLAGDGVSLFLIDHTGEYSNYKSDDGGLHWMRYERGAMPKYDTSYCAARAPGGPLLIGTQSGIYKEEGTYFAASSGGLETNTIVYRLAVKKNIYKNDEVKYFVFAATNKGLYRSDDRGYNWKRTTDTTFPYDYRGLY